MISKTSTLMRFIPHMPLMRLCLTPVTGSLYRPLLGLLISTRISLLSLGLGRERPHVILIVFSSDDDLLNPLASAFSPWWGLVIASREILEPWWTKTCCLYGVEDFLRGQLWAPGLEIHWLPTQYPPIVLRGETAGDWPNFKLTSGDCGFLETKFWVFLFILWALGCETCCPVAAGDWPWPLWDRLCVTSCQVSSVLITLARWAADILANACCPWEEYAGMWKTVFPCG